MIDDSALQDRLRRHVRVLAGEIGERNVRRPGNLDRAAAYVEDCLTRCGCRVRRHAFLAEGRRFCNLETEIPGPGGAGSLVVGAHYDSAAGCPGANDNATGIAAMLEVAAACAGGRFRGPLRFVAFVNEEPPFYRTDAMGSLVFARMLRERDEAIAGMLSLETIGCYSATPGSQRYPFPLGLFYPAVGDFVAFVANPRSRRFLRQLSAAFRRRTTFPFIAAALPEFIPGVAWSDQWSFWRHGYPGVMITDTAPFRYPHYHAGSDTPDKIDYVTLTRLVGALSLTVADLAGRAGGRAGEEAPDAQDGGLPGDQHD